MTPPTSPHPIRSAVAAAVIVSVALTADARTQAVPDPNPLPLEESVSKTVRPGDDFFAYANGAWLKSAAIPAGKARWGARDEVFARTQQQILKLIDDARTAPTGSAPRKVADFRSAWLNESAIESNGLAPLRPLLDSINNLQDRESLTRMLGRGMRADVDPLNWAVYRSASILGLSVEESIHGERTNVAFLLQGGLGLPDRDYYLSADPKMQASRATYLTYITKLLALGGFDQAGQRAHDVMALEMAIAQSQGTREATANDRNADNLWTRGDFDRQAPGMDWTAYFAAAGLAKRQAFVAWQPSAIKGVAALVASQPLQVWQDYLRVRALDDHAEILPRAFANAALALRSEVAGQPSTARAQRALEATQLAMGDAIGKMYGERTLAVDQKRRVETVVANVATAFRKRAEGATWMSPATKAITLEKLRTLYVGIGYPDHWQDYSDLVIDPADAVGNARRVAAREQRRAMARLDQPVDMKEWWIAPQVAGAILIFQQNAYEFTAALLQPPKFDAAGSDAAAYGAIGALIGHDISHFVDVLGADYQVDGAMRTWWTAEDRMRFQALADPLVKQFSAYRPFPDLAVDGRKSETESIADLAGLASAFDAYRLTLGARVADREFVRRQDREFFLAFAQSWRVQLSDAGMRQQATADHAPETYRVATVRNLDAWYDAFGVGPGDRLYLAPAARVRIW